MNPQPKDREPQVVPLVPHKDPCLREVTPKFDFANPPTDPIELAYKLADTMMAKKGIGLAAPQIGLPYRAFAIRSDPIIVCFNPLIVDQTTQAKTLIIEGCLSFPGVFVKVARPDLIRVRYTEPSGHVKTTKLSGLTAHVYQHELDHLNGVLFTDYASRLQIEMAIKKAKKYGKFYTMADFKKPVD